jgi:MFS family permease
MSAAQYEASMSGNGAAAPARPRRRLSTPYAIAAVTIGSALEHYDSIAYNFFAVIIGRLYFPVEDHVGQLLLSFATFGLGFLVRPIGGLFIGSYADRRGRKPAIMLTLILMTASAPMLVVTPTYAEIGIAATILLLLARLVQGFALGGEMGSACAMLLEYADDRSRGFYTSWQHFSQGLAAVIAALVAITLSNTLPPGALESWGWRVALEVGLLVIPVSFIIRRRLEETLVPQPKAQEKPRLGVARDHWRELTASVLLMIGLAASVHMTIFYLPNYAVFQLQIPMQSSLWAGLLASAVLMLLSPFAGWLSDRIGRRPILLGSRLAVLVVIYPAFVLLNGNPSVFCLLAAVGVLATAMTMMSPPTMVVVSEILPPQIRATGVALSYWIAIVAFGSFSQFFSTLLINLTGSANAPAFYLIACMSLSLVGVAMVPETLRRTPVGGRLTKLGNTGFQLGEVKP